MELWDAYTRDEVRTGEKLVRGASIPDGVYHLVSEILVCHVDGDFLLMQRDPTKIAYPGYWEATAGGSALVGEGPIDCAKRELYEETGIADGNFTQISQEIGESIHTIYRGYLCVTAVAKDAIRLQTGETVAYRWLSPADFCTFAKASGTTGMIDHQKNRLLPFLRERFPDANF